MTESFSSRTPQQALAALLEHHAPQHLLLVGARFPALDAFAAAHPDTRIDVAEPGPLPAELAGKRYDLALLVDCLEHLPKRNETTEIGPYKFRILNADSRRIHLLRLTPITR